jgi:hypothetical protein
MPQPFLLTPVIPAIGRLRQEDRESQASLGSTAKFKASLGYTVRSCLKKKKRKKRKEIAGPPLP